jgi:hypothetical protein
MCFMFSDDGCLSTNARYPQLELTVKLAADQSPCQNNSAGCQTGSVLCWRDGGGEGASKTIWKMEKNNKFQI